MIELQRNNAPPYLLEVNLAEDRNLIATENEDASCCGYRKTFYPITGITTATAAASILSLLRSIVMEVMKQLQYVSEQKASETISSGRLYTKRLIMLSVAISGTSMAVRLAIKCAQYITGCCKLELRVLNKLDRCTEGWGTYPLMGTIAGFTFPFLLPCYSLIRAVDRYCPHRLPGPEDLPLD